MSKTRTLIDLLMVEFVYLVDWKGKTDGISRSLNQSKLFEIIPKPSSIEISKIYPVRIPNIIVIDLLFNQVFTYLRQAHRWLFANIKCSFTDQSSFRVVRVYRWLKFTKCLHFKFHWMISNFQSRNEMLNWFYHQKYF